ncbi:hypothetical protein A3D79_00070 [Candidatus Daviesbacteria bacterium RIFCSPHIGHO2_02_FULL_39_8]|nr:MAG: hypothetical protein A3D79_00070 [Candidatus Daviesbacteria bacterium RIFCSPHIGHO2_02_FULL_39_8]
MPNPTFNVKLASPSSILFEGKAESVTSTNSKGLFDILADHANFITLIENKPIIIRVADKLPLTFTFPIAIIYTSSNRVNIYTYSQSQSS